MKAKIAVLDTKAAVEKQKLIHSGRILVDDKTVADCGVKDGDFLVLMVSSSTISKPKPSTAVPAATNVPAAEAPSVAAPAGAPSTTAASTATASVRPASTASSAFVNEAAVNSLCEMGFPKEEAARALAAAFGNPDRAVEYLMTGIPEGVAEEANAPTGADGEDESDLPAEVADAMNADPSNPLAFLRTLPQFVQLRLVVQQNPRLLGPLLEQIAQSNPEIFQLISENQEGFMSMIQAPLTETELQSLGAALDDEEHGEEEDGDDGEEGEGAELGGSGAPSSRMIQVTEEEMAAIDRLMALGFDRPRAIEAYLACDKNETVAANFLFEHMNDDDF